MRLGLYRPKPTTIPNNPRPQLSKVPRFAGGGAKLPLALELPEAEPLPLLVREAVMLVTLVAPTTGLWEVLELNELAALETELRIDEATEEAFAVA